MAKLIENLKKFLKEVKAEMSKVTWPSWLELKGSTLLVIIVSIFFSVYVGIVDVMLTFVRNFWL